jgi:hypothetical protein
VVVYPEGTSPRVRRSGSRCADDDRGAGYGPDVEHGDEDVVGGNVVVGATVKVVVGATVVVGLVVRRSVVATVAAVLWLALGVLLAHPDEATLIAVVANITASQRRMRRW